MRIDFNILSLITEFTTTAGCISNVIQISSTCNTTSLHFNECKICKECRIHCETTNVLENQNVSKSERFLTNHHYSISQIERILEFRKFWNQNLDVRENLNLMITYSGMSDLY